MSSKPVQLTGITWTNDGIGTGPGLSQARIRGFQIAVDRVTLVEGCILLCSSG